MSIFLSVIQKLELDKLGVFEEIDEERASNRFAGAFLLPKKALI